jgi:hypothetical protein
MRKFIIHIFKRHDWEISDASYGEDEIPLDDFSDRDNDLNADVFGLARIKDNKIIQLFDPFPLRDHEMERLKKDPRFQEKVEFECYVVTEEDKRPFKVKDRFKGPLWKGLEYVNENLGL